MKQQYIALLRGVNVGGKGMIKMSELVVCLDKAGLENVRTYIQSGNVLFGSTQTDTAALTKKIEQAIAASFGVTTSVVVISKQRWQKIVAVAPKDWGVATDWKHNVLVLLEPYDMQAVVAGIGQLKPDMETLTAGDGVLYQSVSIKLFGRTTTGKLASNSVYKQMTIRNYNTACKLSALLEEA